MNNNWLTDRVLVAYLDGTLDEKTMHEVERLSLEDPFVAEALAGLSEMRSANDSLSILQKRLQDRVAQKPVEKKRWLITSQRLSIAAAASVIFIAGSLLFWMREKNNRDKLAAISPKQVEVAIAQNNADTVTQKKKDELVAQAIQDSKNNQLASKSKKVTEVEKSSAPILAATPASEALEVQAAPTSLNKTIARRSASVSKAERENELAGTVADKNTTAIEGASILNPSGNSLREVAVAKMGTVTLPLSTPEGGWAKFEEYVLKNNRLSKAEASKGRFVYLTFQFDDKGLVIQVSHLPLPNADGSKATSEEISEAIRLLQSGPKWLKEKQTKLPYQGQVKIAF